MERWKRASRVRLPEPLLGEPLQDTDVTLRGANAAIDRLPNLQEFVVLAQQQQNLSNYALYSRSRNPVAMSTTTLLFGREPATPYNAAELPIALPLAPWP